MAKRTPRKSDELANITSRDDLSFTQRDSKRRINNWNVPHEKEGSWHVGLELGYLYFSEVAELASHDEDEAYLAIRCAMEEPGWWTGGWGIECGFSRALARAAIVGLRALRDGKESVFCSHYDRV